jgi:hypothetical protein
MAERARLREQARDWLKADLVAWRKRLEGNESKARPTIQQTLAHWKADSDLAGLRDEPYLAKLSEAERETCLKLWAEVDDLLRKAKGTSQ